MADDLKALESQALGELQASGEEAALRAWYTKYFGDKGLVKAALGKLGSIPKDQREAISAVLQHGRPGIGKSPIMHWSNTGGPKLEHVQVKLKHKRRQATGRTPSPHLETFAYLSLALREPCAVPPA